MVLTTALLIYEFGVPVMYLVLVFQQKDQSAGCGSILSLDRTKSYSSSKTPRKKNTKNLTISELNFSGYERKFFCSVGYAVK